MLQSLNTFLAAADYAKYDNLLGSICLDKNLADNPAVLTIINPYTTKLTSDHNTILVVLLKSYHNKSITHANLRIQTFMYGFNHDLDELIYFIKWLDIIETGKSKFFMSALLLRVCESKNYYIIDSIHKQSNSDLLISYWKTLVRRPGCLEALVNQIIESDMYELLFGRHTIDYEIKERAAIKIFFTKPVSFISNNEFLMKKIESDIDFNKLDVVHMTDDMLLFLIRRDKINIRNIRSTNHQIRLEIFRTRLIYLWYLIPCLDIIEIIISKYY